MALGFAQDNNLRESQDPSSAAGIFNNLAGVGIADDIKLFAGNLSSTHELNYGADGYTAGKDPYSSPEEVLYDPSTMGVPDVTYEFVVIPVTVFGRKPYANGTVLYTLDDQNNQVYHITGDSNGVDRFKIYEYDNVAKTKGPVRNWSFFYNLTTKIFYRSEPVLFNNIANLSAQRILLNDESGGFRNIASVESAAAEGQLAAGRNAGKTITFLKLQSISGNRAAIETARDTLLYKQGRNLVSYKQNAFNRLIEFGGPTHIVNPNNLALPSAANQYENQTTMPGIYIYGGGISARAFSDTNNPWVKETGYTLTGTNTTINAIKSQNYDSNFDGNATNSQSARVLNLIWKLTPTIYAKGTGANQSVRSISSPVTVADNWTHKAKVTINGENYFLLLTDQESTFT